MLIYGKNVVKETIFAHPEIIRKIFVKKDKMIDEYKEFNYNFVENTFFKRNFPNKKHQGIAAEITDLPTYDLSYLEDFYDENALWVLLDSVQDPHNLGSIARTLYGLGASGLILPSKRTAEITPTVFSASAGYINRLPIVRIKNPANSLKRMKQAGYWLGYADMHGDIKIGEKGHDFPMPFILIFGSEGSGVKEIYKKLSDYSFSIPQKEEFDSFNLSVSVALVVWELMKQR